MEEHQSEEEKVDVLGSLSRLLSVSHGPHFRLENIVRMKKLAHNYPELMDVVGLAGALSWEQISCLLLFDNLEERQYYTFLTLKNELRIDELKDRITKNEFKTKVFEFGNETSIDLSIQELIASKTILVNHFKEPLNSSFRPLLERRKAPLTLNEKENFPTGKSRALLNTLNLHISDYQNWLNGWFNSALNDLFWQIGSEINSRVKASAGEFNKMHLISRLAEKFSFKGEGLFGNDSLSEMAWFAEQITDPAIARHIGSLIPWSHIVELIGVAELEAKLFYARLSAEQNLGVGELKVLIRENKYQHTVGAKEYEQRQVESIRNPIIKSKLQLRAELGDSTQEEMSRKLMRSVRQNRINVFQNPHFMSFVTAYG